MSDLTSCSVNSHHHHFSNIILLLLFYFLLYRLLLQWLYKEGFGQKNHEMQIEEVEKGRSIDSIRFHVFA
eukprot:scaffold3777_cov88-Cylindrotheca_fusiformis.AAC.1